MLRRLKTMYWQHRVPMKGIGKRELNWSIRRHGDRNSSLNEGNFIGKL